MKEWICTKCGELASSKCPAQRTIFMEDQDTGLLNARTCVTGVTNSFKTEITLSLADYTCSTSKVDMCKEIYKLLDYIIKQDKLQAFCCDHNWVLNSTEKITCYLGCEHPNLSSQLIPFEEVKDNYNEASKALRIALGSIHSVIRGKELEITDEARNILLNQIYDYIQCCKEERQITYIVKYRKERNWKTATFEELEVANDFRKMLKAQGIWYR